MKIISLNAWGGVGGTVQLISFFKSNNDTDIFCLQEIFNGGENDEHEKSTKQYSSKEYNLFTLIKEVLPNHTAFFRSSLKEYSGLALFVKKDVKIIEEGEVFIHKDKGYIPTGDIGLHARNMEYVKIKHDGRDLCVINIHGLWNGKGKYDSEERLEQSKKIINFVKNIKGEVILCGDFNLTLQIESIRLLEAAGLINLIKEYGVSSTRTSRYLHSDKYADYIFTTKGVKVKDFKVLPDEVSDHAPLYIEIL